MGFDLCSETNSCVRTKTTTSKEDALEVVVSKETITMKRIGDVRRYSG